MEKRVPVVVFAEGTSRDWHGQHRTDQRFVALAARETPSGGAAITATGPGGESVAPVLEIDKALDLDIFCGRWFQSRGYALSKAQPSAMPEDVREIVLRRAREWVRSYEPDVRDHYRGLIEGVAEDVVKDLGRRWDDEWTFELQLIIAQELVAFHATLPQNEED